MKKLLFLLLFICTNAFAQYDGPGTPRTGESAGFFANSLSKVCFLIPSVCVSLLSYVNPDWYGAVSNGVSCDNLALVKAQNALGSSGGKIVLSAKSYHMCAEFDLASNVILQGQGMDGTTVLNFSSTAAGDGVGIHGTFDNKIRDLQIFGAFGNAIGIYGIADGYSGNPIGVEISNVRMTGVQTGACIRFGGAVTSSYHDLICVSSPTYSYNFVSFTTSQHLWNVYSVTATQSGFNFNNTVYSDCNGCYSDSSGQFGYIFTNVSAFHCVPCAGEANPSGLYDVAASTAIGSGATVPDIHGLVLQPFSFQNGTSGGAPCTLLATSSNSKTVDVSMLGGSEQDCTNSISFTMTGVGVAIKQFGGTYLGSKLPSSGATFVDVSQPARSQFTVAAVNFNSANTDNTINIPFPPGAAAYRVAVITIGNLSSNVSLTTATFGIFSSTGGGGTTLLANGAVPITITNNTANTNNNGMTTVSTNNNTTFYTFSQVFFRIGTASGVVGTSDVTLGVDWIY